MTREEAQARIAEFRITQRLHRDELIAELAAWEGGPTPPRARYLCAELADIEGRVEELVRHVSRDPE